MTLDVVSLRAEFPLLARTLAGQRLVHLDCASTAPRSRRVLESIRRYHDEYTANVHRGVHPFAAEASAAYEAVRHVVATHVGASPAEVVFVRGTTEAINLVAAGLMLREGDEVVVTHAEHHSNSLPWRARATLRAVPSNDDGSPRWDRLGAQFGPRTRVCAVHHASNVLGGIAPLREIVALAHAHGVPVLVDGAQGAGHLAVDLEALDCDFYAFSGHKLGAPAGSGVLVARNGWLDRLEPTQWGGGMVATVRDDAIELRDGPHRFEPGTPNVEGVLGLAAALGLLREVGMDAVQAHGRELAAALLDGCRTLPGVRVLGDAASARIPLVSLVLPERGLDAETVARTIADASGILVSAGRHCAHGLHDRCGAAATLRASAWLVNDLDDVARFVAALRPLIA
ncbi:MAG: aminotransferase class V-fold PLP-dependent enzyme [Planctomycetes bacterium]|nr:aminotransferase class V-fold PLP-dependent enzyme [Planctomycetota bacterium]